MKKVIGIVLTVLGGFGILFAIVFVAFNIVYFISLLLKKKNIYRATYLIAFALFICKTNNILP